MLDRGLSCGRSGAASSSSRAKLHRISAMSHGLVDGCCRDVRRPQPAFATAIAVRRRLVVQVSLEAAVRWRSDLW